MDRRPHRVRKNWERILETIPALLTWITFIMAIYLSATHPAWAAIYIIVLDIYWLSKAFNSTAHMLTSFKKYKTESSINWLEALKELSGPEGNFLNWIDEKIDNSSKRLKKYYLNEKNRYLLKKVFINHNDLYHIVLFPFVDESENVLSTSINGVLNSNYDKKKIILVLASEERAGEEAQKVANILKNKYQSNFYDFLISCHPDGLLGEIRGKGPNSSYAVEKIVIPYLVEKNISIDNVVISNLDSDTIIDKEYLARITYEWCMSDRPHRMSYQPIPFYNNNIWQSPSWVRIVAIANTFWLLIESSRPDRLTTFSSHSMSLRALVDVGFWKKDVVNEDSCIFYQCYFHYNGDYYLRPVFISVSMDTCLDNTYKKTLINQYKQRRRWAYNVEMFPWITKNLWLNSKLPFLTKLNKYFLYVEGNYHWATASIVLASMGFLPTFLGNNFSGTVLGYNLPVATQLLLSFALLFLIFYVYVSIQILPPRPKEFRRSKAIGMYLQWALLPILSIPWVSIPAIDSQTRLAFGKYMEFWVTPKSRNLKFGFNKNKRETQI